MVLLNVPFQQGPELLTSNIFYQSHYQYINNFEFCIYRVLQPGNELLSGSVPLGTPYPVLRYEGGTSYTMCSAFPCRREYLTFLMTP